MLAVALIFAQVSTVSMAAVSSQEYATLQVGQDQNEVRDKLPGNGTDELAPGLSEPSRPAGSQCAYFQARDAVFDFSIDVYRLCFDEGSLVSKDHLTTDNP